MSFSLFLDIIIVMLLVATIVYAVLLNAKLKTLRDSKKEMSRFVQAFNEATVRAETGIPKLRKATDAVGADLKDILHKAQMIRDDLAFMIEKADKVADRLERNISEDKKEDDGKKTYQEAEKEVKETPKKTKEDKEDISSRASKTMLGALAMGEEIELDEERSEAELELLRAIRSIK